MPKVAGGPKPNQRVRWLVLDRFPFLNSLPRYRLALNPLHSLADTPADLFYHVTMMGGRIVAISWNDNGWTLSDRQLRPCQRRKAYRNC